jgi:aminopeptidase N
MKFLQLALVYSIITSPIMAQTADKDTTWKNTYRAAADKINNLIHTKLKVKPNYETRQLLGEEWVTLTPHFYPVNTLTMHARSMNIDNVYLVTASGNKKLVFEYNSPMLTITLDRTYKAGEKYTLYIPYTANPEKIISEEGLMLENKGIYFINADGKTPDKPTQIWTQGETEQASSWFPTIDKTNQRCTQEMYITVPNKYVTLSNGLLKSQVKNADGTRTDYWNMDLPHAPYLFFIGVGEYAVIKDSYKGKPVNYFVEKEYAGTAKKIFGNTPEMIGFFSKKLGVEYPWAKYDQITGRDYVAGAMENTTAVIHQESAQQDARELTDGNRWESTIAHELFHHWFGDLVTCESWSNLTLNESFADYSEYLWSEYKYGRDKAEEENEEAKQSYFFGGEKKHLVRFHYKSQEDMFDNVSYQKGGRILHMLRYYLGDDAFFKGLNKYLTDNKFKSTEVHQLRLAFEEVSGKDLNWFFNQWYYNAGHAKVTLNYNYDEAANKMNVSVEQTTEKPFILPVQVDMYYADGTKERQEILINDMKQDIVLSCKSKPVLVNVDGDRSILWVKKDNRPDDFKAYEALYKRAGLYQDRLEALKYFAKSETAEAKAMVLEILTKDKFSGIRQQAVQAIDKKNITKGSNEEKALLSTLNTEKSKSVNATILNKLASTDQANDYEAIYSKYVNDSSYTVAGIALRSLAKVSPTKAKEWISNAKNVTNIKGVLRSEVKKMRYVNATDADFDAINNEFAKLDVQGKFEELQTFAKYLGTLKSLDNIKKGIESIITVRNVADNFGVGSQVNGIIKNIKSSQEKNGASAEVLKYITDNIKTYKEEVK